MAVDIPISRRTITQGINIEYSGTGKSLARPSSRCILFDGENISFDASLGFHKRIVQFQKLTRNVFLILHWHNLHRQQWQIFKFRMRYQQFASLAYCGAAGQVYKIASQQEKAFVCFVLRCPDP
jgi:hypothetical protein